jgi:hypothetical protein
MITSLLSFCNYYRIFVKGFSSIVQPLIMLTQIDQEQAFHELKAQLSLAPILR